MTKQFAMLVGWVLIIVGILNFFLEPIKVLPAHAVFHIVAGALGVILVKNHRGYAMWVGIIGTLLAILGFAGIGKEDPILGLIDLPSIFDWVHIVLGLAGFAVFFMSKKGGMGGASMQPRA